MVKALPANVDPLTYSEPLSALTVVAEGIGVDSGQDHGSTSTFGDAAVGNDGLDIQFREGRARFPDIERADRAAEVEVAGDGGRGGGSRRSCFADDEKSASVMVSAPLQAPS